MSQEEPKEYEILYFVSATLEANELKQIQTKINAVLIKHQSNIIKESNLGKHKLAYMIKQARHGYFLLVTFTTLATEVNNINYELKLMPEILRHKLTIKQKNTTGTINNNTRQENSEKLTTDSYKKPTVALNNKTLHQEKSKEVKVDTQELDRKIDELLDDNNI